jgi:glycerophosphoryl diester phosphodiesterase
MILLDPEARPVIGHRGNRAHAPENTLESLQQAVALGADAVEFDLHVTADGVLVLLHDPTLDRTTSGRGPVARRTLAELRDIDAGARFTTDGGRSFPWRGRSVGVPTFDEVVEALPADLPLIIELKTPAATSPIRDAISRHGIAHRVIVAGFDARAVHPLRGDGFALGASRRDVLGLLWPALAGAVPRIGFQALCMPPRWYGVPLPMAAFARAMRRVGGTTHVWTVNDPAEARRLWAAGVQGIISDDPGRMLQVRRDAGHRRPT